MVDDSDVRVTPTILSLALTVFHVKRVNVIQRISSRITYIIDLTGSIHLNDAPLAPGLSGPSYPSAFRFFILALSSLARRHRQ